MICSETVELKLVDFGFSKFMTTDRTFTKCGTPGYSAPEVLQQADIDSTFDVAQGRLSNKQAENGK